MVHFQFVIMQTTHGYRWPDIAAGSNLIASTGGRKTVSHQTDRYIGMAAKAKMVSSSSRANVGTTRKYRNYKCNQRAREGQTLAKLRKSLSDSSQSVTDAATSKSQIDKLGERLKRGERSRDSFYAVAEFRNRFIPATEAVAERIVAARPRFKFDITQRPAKSTPSIVGKLTREHSRLSQIQDIGGLRLVVSKVSVQERAVQLVKRLYQNARVVDRRSLPQHGYRAVHVIVEHNGCYIEVQVRTRLQNGWAQYSEKLADMHGMQVKYGRGTAQVRKDLTYLSDAVKSIENYEAKADEQKRLVMNELFRRKREGVLTTREQREYDNYQRLRA